MVPQIVEYFHCVNEIYIVSITAMEKLYEYLVCELSWNLSDGSKYAMKIS